MAPRRPLEEHIKTEADVKATKVGLTKVLGWPNLYLKVTATGLRRYVYRCTIPEPYRGNMKQPVAVINVGKPGLPLNKAKGIAAQYAEWLRDGRDPREILRWKPVEEATFKQVATEWLEHNQAENGESWLRQAKNFLYGQGYVESLLGLRLIRVTSKLIHKALAEKWKTHPGQVRRAADMYAEIFNFAGSNGYPVGQNPALWDERLKHLFSRKKIIRKSQASMPPAQVPAFVQQLHQRQQNEKRATAARALELTVLTGLRTSEVREAEWREFDLENAIWIIPAPRMKNRREHRVPLTDRVLQILRTQQRLSRGKYVFTGYKEFQPLSEKSMLLLLRSIGITKEEATVHGFRNTLGVWCAEGHDFDPLAVDMCLAHTIKTSIAKSTIIGSQSLDVYIRTTLFDKRKRIMQAWADYCEGH
jgi:integrase